MQRYGFSIDASGYVIGSVLLEPDEEIPSNVIVEGWQEPLIIPKYDFEFKRWIEGATLEQLEEIKNSTSMLSDIEQLKEEQKMTSLAVLELAEMMLGG
jgi:hypothetical protein